MSDEKTEEPSQQKLKKTREEGQVAKSADVVETACLAAVFLALQAGGAHIVDTLRALLTEALDFAGTARDGPWIANALIDIGIHAAALLAGVAVLALGAALLALMPQTGMQIAMKAVMPKLNAVSPGSGFQKIFSMNAAIDLAKMVCKAIVLLAVMWSTIRASLPVVASALDRSIPQLCEVMWSVTMHVVAVALGVFGVIAAVDFKLQKWLFIRKNRMSKDEVKREHKESEGNPEMKGERKRLARKLVNEGPKQGVGRANVVVVNPAHYAVALRYDPAEFPLPVVIARGLDEHALLLRRYAAEAGVPIVANAPVARMLHRVPENQPIPEALFEAVAAILRWVDGLAAASAKADSHA
ncbi:flagellar type III secretion system protein FlhB [Paraburkholderia sp. Ac-20340]|uniref:type III secretion system export apparatus subunit SctU n=1 Tax=Paraburkholderia sp. Ac-20340 TaxID=2703888 RepID=UPI00197D3802|nr:type III secretion system export apparatus subunit SctU [Paraburkholderia sp. Ac-20340]MBN3857576.1 flagellar type III secretion system protein FlhB [Paraburkholderia sp. Ac-20340]